jgi:oligopeptide/dipeptide ABC transporter ATP-binding protein
MGALLNVDNLSTVFHTERGLVKAVDRVSYTVDESEIIGIVGESGCGKSVTQMSVMQLIPTPPGKIISGKVEFEGVDLLQYPKAGSEMCAIRGNKITMVFQEPMTSLNPAMTIGKQMSEVLIIHKKLNKKDARDRSIEMLDKVGIPDSTSRVDDYPHQMSGGMRQRVMVAMAMLCNPKMIIADEATTALDATIQAQLLELLYSIVSEFHTALVMVTHNLGIVARYVQRVNVMYAGRIIETGSVNEMWENPLHPYTQSLLACVPTLGKKLEQIPGMPPTLINRPDTCSFLPRCKERRTRCFEQPCSELTDTGGGHKTTCTVRLEGLG